MKVDENRAELVELKGQMSGVQSQLASMERKTDENTELLMDTESLIAEHSSTPKIQKI